MTIDIIRRDTLAATHQVNSPLARLSAAYADVLSPPPVPAGADGDTAPLPWPRHAMPPDNAG